MPNPPKPPVVPALVAPNADAGAVVDAAPNPKLLLAPPNAVVPPVPKPVVPWAVDPKAGTVDVAEPNAGAGAAVPVPKAGAAVPVPNAGAAAVFVPNAGAAAVPVPKAGADVPNVALLVVFDPNPNAIKKK